MLLLSRHQQSAIAPRCSTGQLLQCSVVFSNPQWGQLTMVILGSRLSDVSDAVSSRLLTSLVTYKGVRYQSILIWVIVWTQNQLLSWTCQAFLPTCLLLLFTPVWICICVFASVFVCLPTLSVHGSQGWPVRQYDEDEMMTQRYCVSRQFIRRPCVRYQQWVSTVDT